MQARAQNGIGANLIGMREYTVGVPRLGGLIRREGRSEIIISEEVAGDASYHRADSSLLYSLKTSARVQRFTAWRLSLCFATARFGLMR